MSKPTHDVLLAEEYTTKDNGEVKTHFTNIGSAWQSEKGAISCDLRAGLAVSGRFVILPKKEKSESNGGE